MAGGVLQGVSPTISFRSTGSVQKTTTLEVTNFTADAWVNIATIPLDSLVYEKDLIVDITAVTPLGTCSDLVLILNLAWNASNYASMRAQISSFASHSYSSSSTTENGLVIVEARVGLVLASNIAVLQVRKYKDNSITIYSTPRHETAWEFRTGTVTSADATPSNSRTTSTAAGINGDNIVANSASTASYATGLYNGYTLSNATDNTGKWEYFANIYMAYNSTYRYGLAHTAKFLLHELDSSKDADELDVIEVTLSVSLPTVSSNTIFQATTPTIAIDISGKTNLTVDDFAFLVYSNSTSSKSIRAYIKLKDANTVYGIIRFNLYGGSYSSTRGITSSYCYSAVVAGQAVLDDLPTPAQGVVTYGVFGLNQSTIVNFTGATDENEVAIFDSSGVLKSSSSFVATDEAILISDKSFLLDGDSGETPTSGAGTRLMWVPELAAFRAGIVSSTQWDSSNIGLSSFSAGVNTLIQGDASCAFGDSSSVSGDYSCAFGCLNTVTASYAVSFGRQNVADGYGSVCYGYNCEANGQYSLAGGSGSDADGDYAFAWGYANVASGVNAVAIGNSNVASGSNSLAVGTSCTSYGSYSMAQGSNCIAQGYASFASGQTCKTLTDAYFSKASGSQAQARGYGYDVLAVGNFESQGDAQYVKTVLRGKSDSDYVLYVDTPHYYIVPENTTVFIHAYFSIRADDGVSAGAVRSILAEYDGTYMNVLEVNTVGSDVDPDGIIDYIDIGHNGDGELYIEVGNTYSEDFGVVCKLEIVENAYLKPST